MKKDRAEDTISRAIYRDPQFKRVPKKRQLSPIEEQIKNSLAEAGMDWNEPLSASSYQNWHDRQQVRKEKVSRAGTHLLRLTTTVPDGLISEQSLTVREDDFHPIGRTIAMRNSATVEIAEVDFKILPWNAVAEDAFEPPVIAEDSVSPSRVLPIPLPRQTELLSEVQLDAAELGTRLVLNQLRADTGEELRIERHPEGIVLRGIVGSEERKQILEEKLQFVPHASVKIQSIEEISAKPESGGTVQTVAVGTMPEHLSSLQVYLKANGRSVSEINHLTQRLYHDVLTISQESKEIKDLQTRFGDESKRTLIVSATLSELIYSHHERLENALRNERALLSEIHKSSPSLDAATKNAGTLIEAADTNFALTQELTQAQQTDGRDTDMILDEVASVLVRLALVSQNPYDNAQRTQALSGKR
jgi:hypothetical protein